ncbi:DUF2812 domain-containing protein [Proteiniclasticum sp.]|uniref:DUF2812 domain-containing protein n=1 Tax=Proteiniclasticum sp. TaxID=2053595 RepID=UPI00289AE46D|nr:DUF2812 domain-containing protein [Proteiniclasticum sp.]
MKTIETVWFWWWGWSPDNMENMLERMEASGWKLFQVDWWGIRFRFTRGEEEKVRYSVDYQPAADEDYLTLFDEDGWKMKWTGAGGWYLWRKPYVSERPEIFTESSSLIERNNRLLKLLTPLFVMLIIIFIIMLLFQDHRFLWLTWIYAVLIAIYVYMIAQLQKFNRKLKNEIRE